MNLHSGEYAVYVPWDSKASLAPNLPLTSRMSWSASTRTASACMALQAQWLGGWSSHTHHVMTGPQQMTDVRERIDAFRQCMHGTAGAVAEGASSQ